MNLEVKCCTYRLFPLWAILVSMSSWLASFPVSAAEESKSASEIAAELANPNTTLGSMNFNLDYVSYTGDLPGAGSQNAVRLTFQPVLPYPLGKGVNLFVRPAVPIIFKQDLPTAGGYDNPGFNLGDTGFDAALGKSFSNGLVLVGGVVGSLPTATDDDLGKDQWALGPEAAAAIVRKWGVLGLLVSHQWDVAGDDDFDTDLTGGAVLLHGQSAGRLADFFVSHVFIRSRGPKRSALDCADRNRREQDGHPCREAVEVRSAVLALRGGT